MQNSFTPSQHQLLMKEKTSESTSRQYLYKTQRNRLLRLTVGEWLNTLVLCVAYFGILYAYSKKLTISVPQRRVFNALTTGVSLLLGVNLAASLRSYAKLVRWRMLAASYRPLETFDLVMGCDSLVNVLKLLLKAKNSQRKYLPSKTQVYCFLWLLVHLAVTILVGIIGLNYNLDTSQDYVLLKTGTVSIVDLNSLSTGDYLSDLGAVQEWGVRGEVTTALDLSGISEYTSSYFTDDAGYTLYYFQDSNAKDSSQSGVSARYFQAQAYCSSYKVTEGQYGNLSYVVYNGDGGKKINQSLPAVPGPGGLLTMSQLNSTCGPRCVDIQAFQAGALEEDGADDLLEGMFFVCNNTVPQVGVDTGTLTSPYLVIDLVATMLAGAIGWNDLPPVSISGTGLDEYELYSNISDFGFVQTPSDTDMANAISGFTMGAVAIMDASPGMARKDVSNGREPIPAQILTVQWRFAGAILAVIPFIHFWTLLAVIKWANHAIIKDESHLAIAKVYQSLLHRRLGDRGCLLRGDEMVEVLGNPSVAYGWSWNPDSAREHEGSMHVDVFEEDSSHNAKVDRPFVEGWYDGESRPPAEAAPASPESWTRRRYRDVDAADYF
jgi:hypothetical protein